MPPENHLASALELPNGQRVKNRLLKSAMSEALGTRLNQATRAHELLYGRWARGGIGLSVTGNVMVDRRAIGEPGNVVLEDDRDMAALTRWATAARSEGGLCYVQLNHPGRQVPRFLNRRSVAPSAVPFSARLAPGFAKPRALEHSEILDLVGRFATAAALCEQAGFDGVQLHGAHGYLVSQFLSPHTNRRDDAWGGDPARRRRFLVEVLRAMDGATSQGFGIALKINSADFQRGGTGEDENRETMAVLDAEGLQFIELSGGTYEAPAMMGLKESTRSREAYFLAFAESIRSSMQTPLVVTGGFRSAAAMNEALCRGSLDMVGLARPLALFPDLPHNLLADPDAVCTMPDLHTGIGMLDRLKAFDLVWYERQLHRMGTGSEPRPGEHPLWALLVYLLRAGPRSLRRRRV